MKYHGRWTVALLILALAPGLRLAGPLTAELSGAERAELQAAREAELRGDAEEALRLYESIYEATVTSEPERANLRSRFAALRPQVAPNLDPRKAGVWKVKAYAFRELDFSWDDRRGRQQHARYRYRDEELERLRRGMAGFAERVWRYTDGNLRIDWELQVIDQPLTKLDGDDSFWPGPDACMPHLADLRAGDTDTVMVFVKVFGDASLGEESGEVPQMLLGGALGSLGEYTKNATYIGFNWGTGTAADEPDGEPMLHEWLHSAQWALEDYQLYPRDLMFTSDGGRREGEEGGDPCYRRQSHESSWMGFYEHLMRAHVTRKMWRELSVSRPPDNVWANTYCRHFLVLGPFPAEDRPVMGLDHAFIDERRAVPTVARNADPHRWRAVDTPTPTLDLAQVLGPHAPAVAYVAARVRCANEQSAQLRIGSDDGCRVWHNGQLVLSAAEPRGVAPDQNLVEVTLTPGDHLFLMKVANIGGGWAAILRLTDSRGGPLPGVTYARVASR